MLLSALPVLMMLSSLSEVDTRLRSAWFSMETARRVSARATTPALTSRTRRRPRPARSSAPTPPRPWPTIGAATADSKGIYLSEGPYRLNIGPTTADYGDILINGGPIEIE